MTKYCFIIAGVIIAITIGIGCIVSFKHKERLWSAEYARLLDGSAEISSIEFAGQRRTIRVSDWDIIHDFEEALVNGRGKLSRTGLAYKVTFIFISGVQIQTDLYLYVDNSGFALSDYTHVGAIDPILVNAEFKTNTIQKTKDIILTLQ